MFFKEFIRRTSVQSSDSDPSCLPDERQSLLNASPPHQERRFDSGQIMRDLIIGFADGLTVPFALTASLSSVGSTRIVVLCGLAELFAGAISMGLGGYLATITEIKAYECEEAKEKLGLMQRSCMEEDAVYQIFEKYGLGRDRVKSVVDGLKMNPELWVKFMMDFHLKLEKPNPMRAWISALTLGLSYFIGGLIPLLPYFIFHAVMKALAFSVAITALVLLAFGYFKAVFTGTSRRVAFWSAIQTLAVGAAAAGTSYWIVRGVNSLNPIDTDGKAVGFGLGW